MPGNFDEGKVSVSNVESFVKAGFRIGEKVVVIRRFTVKYGKNDNERRDINVGTETFVKAFIGTEFMVCEFEVETSKTKSTKVEWKVNIDKLQIASAYEAEQALEGETTAKAAYHFLKDDATNVDVVEGWEGNLLRNDSKAEVAIAKNAIQFALDCIASQLPEYTSKELALVKRKNEVELWTLKDFKAGEIMFAPESTEMKSLFWTKGRSALVKNTCTKVNLGRSLVLDGRVRGSPDGKSGFALFWVVTRTPESDPEAKKKNNLELTYVDIKLRMEMKHDGPGKDKVIEKDPDHMPSFPILTNPKKILKNTLLSVAEDADLEKLAKKYEDDKVKEEAAKDKKRKAEEAATAAASKKAKKEPK